MLSAYRQLAAEREAQGIPALPLTAEQVEGLTKLLENPITKDSKELLYLLTERIPPGVDEAAYVKATWLSSISHGHTQSPLVSPLEATRLLGTMVGGYNVAALVEILQSENQLLASCAAKGLSHTLLVYDAVNEVFTLSKTNNNYVLFLEDDQKAVKQWDNEIFKNINVMKIKLFVVVNVHI